MLNLDYLQQTIDNIPTLKRVTNRIDWMYLQSKPLIDQNNSFDIEYTYYDFLARHTGQIISLEHLLNTLLSPSTPIFITDGDVLVNTYIYIDNEPFSEDFYIYTDAEAETPIYIYTDEEGIQDYVDFYINLASLDNGLVAQLEYLVGLFKAAGKKYEIIIY